MKNILIIDDDPAQATAEQPATVLVIDDDKQTLDVIEGYLKNDATKLVSSLSGDDIDQQIEIHNPDIIICDLILQSSDGFSVISKARSLKPGVKVIAISADTDSIKAASLFSDKAMSKPLVREELQQAISELAEQA